MRVVSQNMVILISHRRQLRILQRRQLSNIPVEFVGSRVSTMSSPFPEDRSPPTDHKNVEEVRPLARQENAEFQ
jgi:hypothetical protein